jgi:hypothetical protein
MTLARLPECDLPEWHAAFGTFPEAYQCDECKGISFRPVDSPPEFCPYCEEADDEDAAT